METQEASTFIKTKGIAAFLTSMCSVHVLDPSLKYTGQLSFDVKANANMKASVSGNTMTAAAKPNLIAVLGM